ncbi:hypothetical protein BJV74DRAFT_95878 [Russula compacta]|nr:hypothetical protein BJV74DRAFT_95878 [Russula compacta]
MADLQLSLLKANNEISHQQNRLLTLPRSNPLRSVCHSTLAATRLARYMLSDECEDLDRSISHSTQAILLSFDPPIERDSCVVTSLYYLANALLLRSQKFKRLSDLKHCVDYLLYLRDQSLETPLVPRNDISKLLVRALTIQGELELQSVDPTANTENTAPLSRFRKAIRGVPMSSLQPLMDELLSACVH